MADANSTPAESVVSVVAPIVPPVQNDLESFADAFLKDMNPESAPLVEPVTKVEPVVAKKSPDFTKLYPDKNATKVEEIETESEDVTEEDVQSKNFKKVNDLLKMTKAEKLELKKKLDEYESQIAEVDSIKKSKLEIEQELENDRKVNNLIKSNEFKNAFIVPQQQISREIDQLLTDFLYTGTKEENIQKLNSYRQIASSRSNKDLVNFLEDNIESSDARQALRVLTGRWFQYGDAANQALQNASETKQQLEEQAEKDRMLEDDRIVTESTKTSDAAWTSWWKDIESEDDPLPEFSYRKGDAEHNEIVDQVRADAKQWYSEFVDDIKKITKKAIPATLARKAVLASAYAVAGPTLNKSRQEIYTAWKAATSEKSAKAKLDNPSLNGSSSGKVNSNVVAKPGSSPEELGEGFLADMIKGLK